LWAGVPGVKSKPLGATTLGEETENENPLEARGLEGTWLKRESASSGHAHAFADTGDDDDDEEDDELMRAQTSVDAGN
jgi:hypothetical protein